MFIINASVYPNNHNHFDQLRVLFSYENNSTTWESATIFNFALFFVRNGYFEKLRLWRTSHRLVFGKFAHYFVNSSCSLKYCWNLHLNFGTQSVCNVRFCLEKLRSAKSSFVFYVAATKTPTRSFVLTFISLSHQRLNQQE